MGKKDVDTAMSDTRHAAVMSAEIFKVPTLICQWQVEAQMEKEPTAL